MSKLIPIIGLEIHVELKTKSKMFCACPNSPDREAPNTNICEVCLAHPGTLPVPNKQAIVDTVKISRALNCQIAELSKFDRKHYFYPDLPKGYQISQFDEPIGFNGFINLDLRATTNPRLTPKIGITRVHLEEDTAKLLHDQTGGTLVDFNRAGVPLVEIVSDPDIQTALEAKIYCQELQMILRYLGVSDADMEKGHMRCEANISLQEEGRFEITNHIVKPLGDYQLNPKVECKNINSFRAIEKAIEFEIIRQAELLNRGETWIQQTRGWDDEKGETYMQREKESAADYRYFPEPDIPPFTPITIAGEINLPELPAARRARFSDEYGFSVADAFLLTTNEHWSNYTEQVMSELLSWRSSLPETKNLTAELSLRQQKELAKLAGGWLTSKLMGAMIERKIEIKNLKIKAENFAELIALFFANRLNSTNTQKILGEMLDSGIDMDPTHLMEEKGYGIVSDTDRLGEIIDQVIIDNPEAVAKFKAGKEPLIKFLVGMVMKLSEGAADPVITEKILRDKMAL